MITTSNFKITPYYSQYHIAEMYADLQKKSKISNENKKKTGKDLEIIKPLNIQC